MKLDIFEDRYTLHVSWYDDAEGEGGIVGQDAHKPRYELEQLRAKAKVDGEWDSFEYFSVEIAAEQWVAEARQNGAQIDLVRHGGWQFESAPMAKKFLAAMRAAMKSAKSEYDADRPWPEWAKQAQAAGWKPPKGWKP